VTGGVNHWNFDWNFGAWDILHIAYLSEIHAAFLKFHSPSSKIPVKFHYDSSAPTSLPFRNSHSYSFKIPVKFLQNSNKIPAKFQWKSCKFLNAHSGASQL